MICHRCGRPVGILPGPRVRPYLTEVRGNGHRRHYCHDRSSCSRAVLAGGDRPHLELVPNHQQPQEIPE